VALVGNHHSLGKHNPYGKQNFGGKIHTSATKEKMSAAYQERVFSDEHKKKLAEANRGVPFSAERKQNSAAARRGKSIPSRQKRKFVTRVAEDRCQLHINRISPGRSVVDILCRISLCVCGSWSGCLNSRKNRKKTKTFWYLLRGLLY